jgi:hypothetical protein
VTLHALSVAHESTHPSWDGVWFVSDLSAYLAVSEQTIYDACRRGDWDWALAPGTGRTKRFLGPALAARFGVPGFASERGSEPSRD